MKKECDIDSVLNCCHEVRVQLTGKNFEPDWGLFNGTFKYIPLSIAYARTGHTFQGQNVGPKPSNSMHCC
jgi:hypothetical protein